MLIRGTDVHSSVSKLCGCTYSTMMYHQCFLWTHSCFLCNTFFPHCSAAGEESVAFRLICVGTLRKQSCILLILTRRQKFWCQSEILLQISSQKSECGVFQVEQSKVLIKEGGVQLTLTIVDTPGFGDAVDNSNWWGALAQSGCVLDEHMPRWSDALHYPISSWFLPHVCPHLSFQLAASYKLHRQ